jgi:hypothetical protein
MTSADRMAARQYTVFGLRVRSSLELPELFEVSDDAPADVTVEMGLVPEPESAGSGLHSSDGSLVLVVDEVARYKITGGRAIIVEPLPGVPERNVRLFLLGSAFGAILHQRGLLPLHANAIDIDGKAVAFMAESGGGKSTLAAWFHDQGFPLLADDVCVVQLDEGGGAVACPGLPRLRLWLDALESTGRQREGLNRSYVGSSGELDKFDVPVDAGAMTHAKLPVGGLYILERGPAFGLEQLTGLEAAEAIFANTYRGAYVAATSTHRDHWRLAVDLARVTPVYRFVRSMDFSDLDQDCEALLKHVRKAASDKSASSSE